MKKRNANNFVLSAGLLILFILYTMAVMFIDVKPIGPQNSLVGLSMINQRMHDLLGVNMTLYNIIDWASVLTLPIMLGFSTLGLCQLIKRKSLFKVDSSILVLGSFYLVVFATYLFFEFNVVNYRPILINGFLEASYPSSTTMLMMCIMPTAMMQFHRLLQKKFLRTFLNVLCSAFTALMVVGRLLSGVHWFTDILGGILISATLVMLYFSVNRFIDSKYPQLK